MQIQISNKVPMLCFNWKKGLLLVDKGMISTGWFNSIWNYPNA